jgi:branched-chain amino acid transport system substrate-binding protein
MKNVFLQGLKCVAASLFLCAAALAQTQPAPIRLAMIEGLSGGNANGGEAVFRNLVWALERVNERGGVPLPGGAPALVLERYDSKGQIEEALSPCARPLTTARSSSCRAIRRPWQRR